MYGKISNVKTKAQGPAGLNEAQGFIGRRIHFIGIGGIGMSGIASILLRQGYSISGSDVKMSPIIQRLAACGAKIYSDHCADNIEKSDVVIYSSAIKEDNLELKAAKAKGVTVLRRAEALAKLMQDKICIAVSGAHGKTTTTSLATHLLLQAGLFPTAAIGGILRNLDDNAHLGNSKYFIAEADESDGTFLYYKPNYSIVTNIDFEHLDYYHNYENIVKAYAKFISNTKDSGCLFCCGDDSNIREITKGYRGRLMYFGLSKDNDYHADNIQLGNFTSMFSYYYRGQLQGRVNLSLAGEHNISNSLAIIALGRELGIDPKKIEDSLSTFKGTERRFQLKAEAEGVRVIDDYGHHPSEIMATLKAAKNIKHGRLIVVFQPHRYSRTMYLMKEFSKCFSLADYLILTDIYPASEKPIEGVSSDTLCQEVRKLGPKNTICLSKEKISEHIMQMLEKEDLILTLGAGDIGKISDELAERLKRQGSF